MRTSFKVAIGACALGVLVVAAVWLLNVRDEVDVTVPVVYVQDDGLVARGAYLALAGNCMACHTTRGGQQYAGGLGVATPFGTVFSSNLTPDKNTGIGNWSPAHFWRAMHNGRSKSGRLLYPAFPYTSYTQVTRSDSDAIYAYLRSLPAVSQTNRSHALRTPFQTQAALAVWRALYFSPGVFEPDTSRNAEWNRGAYLVQGLGHCSACHSPRDALGGIGKGLDLAGGLIPMQNWYAPSLTSPQEAGVANWDREQIVSLLKNGVSSSASVSGPMAEVVLRSTQHLSQGDLGAMAQYLKELPQPNGQQQALPVAGLPASTGNPARAAKLYEQHCAQCHGDKGQGIANAYPRLAGNRAVTMPSTENLVQMVLGGGYPPATAGNPRPYGMPPFVLVLDDSEVAAVISHIRNSWGNQAGGITPLQVQRVRGAQAR